MHCAFPADSWHRRGQQSNPRPAECPDSSRALFKRSETLARNLRLDNPDRLEKAYEGLVGELPKKPCPTMEGVASVLKLMVQHGLNAKAAQVKPDEIADLSLCKNLRTRVFRSLY
jgi:hypothetical protein